MKFTNLIILSFITFSVYSQQEWDDTPNHLGSGPNSGSANLNPEYQNGRFRSPKLRNREKNALEEQRLPIITKESSKRWERMIQERVTAIEDLRIRYFSQPNQRLGDCGTCAATGINVCMSCEGKGTGRCSLCRGAPQLECRACHGEGLVNDQPCVSCRGTGKKECQFCHGLDVPCVSCNGLGYRNCIQCHGITKIIINRTAADTVKVDEKNFPWNVQAKPHHE